MNKKQKPESKLYEHTAKEWMFALLDVLDGNQYWADIHYRTGLPEDRCKEIEQMFYDATKNGWPKEEREK